MYLSLNTDSHLNYSSFKSSELNCVERCSVRNRLKIRAGDQTGGEVWVRLSHTEKAEIAGNPQTEDTEIAANQTCRDSEQPSYRAGGG
jgi:hypothetical protein